MLRGRCSCTISERPTSSSTLRLLATNHPPLATSSLTPLFPLHPGNSLATPLFPLHTQKQGGTPPSNITNRPISEFSPRILSAPSTGIVGPPAVLISARLSSLRSSANSAPLRYLFLPLFRCSPLATR